MSAAGEWLAKRNAYAFAYANRPEKLNLTAVKDAVLALHAGRKSALNVLEISGAECRFVRTIAFFGQPEDSLFCSDFFTDVEPGTILSAEEYYGALKRRDPYNQS